MNRPRRKDGHLPKCVYIKHGAYWHVKKNKWVLLGKDLRTALERYAELFEVRRSGIDELIDKTLEQHINIAKVAASTAKHYRASGKYLKKALQEFAPDQVRPKHAIAIKRALASTPVTANQVLSVGRIVYGYWLEDELVESNPFAQIKGFKPKSRDRLPTAAEFDAIRTKASIELKIVMDLWRGTGQRVVDVLRIRRADADLNGPGITFRQQKTGKKLTVEWTPELRSAAQRARGLYGNVISLYLIQNQKGGPLSYQAITRRWDAAVAAAGVKDIQRRDLRAMAATEAEDQGKDPTALLGHSERRTTNIYLRDKKTKLVKGPSFRQAIDK